MNLLRRAVPLIAALMLARYAAAGENKQFDLELKNGRIAGGTPTLRVRQGDSVELNWLSSEPAVIHLHGYDVEVKINPGAPVRMRVVAHAAGRYPITLHGAGGRPHERALGFLEVHPK